ncbi:MAG: translation elongation factor Ts, partial [Myxococcales bacterium]|nr:translation elongation factor Ts [Myxococcales bacterium]
GLAKAAKKSTRIAAEGLVAVAVDGTTGAVVEVNSETDFVAKTEDFQQLVRDIAMHIAASAPVCVRREEMPEDLLARERAIYETQAAESGKPANIVEKMVQGKIDKFLKDACLLEQPFVKDPDKTVEQVVKEAVGRIGENVSVRRFARFVLGEGLNKKADDFAAEVAELTGGKA